MNVAEEMRRSAAVIRDSGLEGCERIADGNDEIADAVEAKDAEIARLRSLLAEVQGVSDITGGPFESLWCADPNGWCVRVMKALNPTPQETP